MSNGYRGKTGSRCGLSVLEVLVCIAIIGVLLSLVLPAVQSARESARLTDCRNRMRQIGIACHNFHDSHGAFPKQHRYFHSLLPHLELQGLYDKWESYYTDPNPKALSRISEFGTAPFFICPSGDVDSENLETSYLRSMGTRTDPFLRGVESNGTIFSDFEWQRPVRLSDITDGTSNTAFWSETQAWQGWSPRVRESVPGLYWRQIHQEPGSMRELQQLCAVASGIHNQAPIRQTIISDSYYQHITPPNTKPCAWDYAVPSGMASKPPSSGHDGGVNVLLVDGSVQFVSDVVDEAVWRKQGSRNSDDDFDRF